MRHQPGLCEHATAWSLSAMPALAAVHLLLPRSVWPLHAATVGVITETNAEAAIEELKAYEVGSCACLLAYAISCRP